ncbi:hypothetical protein [Thermocrispum agreste]|jgi:uncharacterized protein YukE|uniref:hypothetical protein n=1 Tax=Thermocrispum agreste TaxID=37925 RepID=UPI000490DB19|nr:hypothetical protein [Thermocrispum agreste]
MSTQVSDAVVEQQASKYETSMAELDSFLERANSHAKSLVDNSPADLTVALQDVCEQWCNNTKNTVLRHMEDMAKYIRKAKDDILDMDKQNSVEILNLPLPTSQFLGG